MKASSEYQENQSREIKIVSAVNKKFFQELKDVSKNKARLDSSHMSLVIKKTAIIMLLKSYIERKGQE